MKKLKFLLLLCFSLQPLAFSLWAQSLQYNRFATTPDGQPVDGGTLTNLQGASVVGAIPNVLTNGEKSVNFDAGTITTDGNGNFHAANVSANQLIGPLQASSLTGALPANHIPYAETNFDTRNWTNQSAGGIFANQFTGPLAGNATSATTAIAANTALLASNSITASIATNTGLLISHFINNTNELIISTIGGQVFPGYVTNTFYFWNNSFAYLDDVGNPQTGLYTNSSKCFVGYDTAFNVWAIFTNAILDLPDGTFLFESATATLVGNNYSANQAPAAGVPFVSYAPTNVGAYMLPYNNGISTSTNIIYVDSNIGNDGNLGIIGSPVASLNQALSLVLSNNANCVILAPGYYTIPSSTFWPTNGSLIGAGASLTHVNCGAQPGLIFTALNTNVMVSGIDFSNSVISPDAFSGQTIEVKDCYIGGIGAIDGVQGVCYQGGTVIIDGNKICSQEDCMTPQLYPFGNYDIRNNIIEAIFATNSQSGGAASIDRCVAAQGQSTNSGIYTITGNTMIISNAIGYTSGYTNCFINAWNFGHVIEKGNNFVNLGCTNNAFITLLLGQQQAVKITSNYVQSVNELDSSTITYTNYSWLVQSGSIFIIVNTNWILGGKYSFPYPIQVSANACLTASAVAGSCDLELEIIGNTTNRSAVQTTALSVAGSYTNFISGFVPANATFDFTNRSSGAGDSATINGGQYIIQ